jgi:hypothetical protein
MEMQAATVQENERGLTPESLPSPPSVLSNSAGVLSPNAPSQDSFYAQQHAKRAASSRAGDAHSVGGAVFPGCYGPLHSVNNKEFAIDSPLAHQLQELTFNEIVDLSYMFNYIEPQGRLGKKRVKVQLDDATWSRPFSLDSVGVNQMITVNNAQRGCMELGFKISVAPGRLAKYTKILRFLPRFSVVNKLPVSLKALQPTGFSGQASETEISAEKVRPYHLPAMFGERQIALQLDGWHRSVAFNIDQIGIFNIQLKRRINLAAIQHVNTRGAPEYSVILQPMRTLGIYFETDWGEENIVVKSLQKGSYATRNTDVKVGDVLLAIDREQLNGKRFDFAMMVIRNRLSSAHGCTLRFRTIEEKMRLIRESALTTTMKTQRGTKRSAGGSGMNGLQSSSHGESEADEGMRRILHSLSYDARDPAGDNPRHRSLGGALTLGLDLTGDIHRLEDKLLGPATVAAKPTAKQERTHRFRNKDHERMVLRVELRQVESSAMVFVQELGAHVSAEYRVENKSVCYNLYYKQKGIPGNSWQMLYPGQSRSYVWEDPFKPHKLLVHTGDNVLSPKDERAQDASSEAGQFLTKLGDGDDVMSTYWGYMVGLNADQATAVSFDEIGLKETLFVAHKTDQKMIATVKSEGPTKILLVTPSLDNRQVIRELRYCTEFINEQLTLLNVLVERLTELARFSPTPAVLTSKLALLDSQFEETLVRMREKQARLLEVDEALQSNPSAKRPSAATRASFGKKKFGPEDQERETMKPSAPQDSDLLAYRPIERVVDLGIERQHQLAICVLEAKELQALVAGKMEDVYCKVVIKSEDLTVVTQ